MILTILITDCLGYVFLIIPFPDYVVISVFRCVTNGEIFGECPNIAMLIIGKWHSMGVEKEGVFISELEVDCLAKIDFVVKFYVYLIALIVCLVGSSEHRHLFY